MGRRRKLEVTTEDYFEILMALSIAFLSTQPDYTHTFIYRNRMYVCRYKRDESMFHVLQLDQDEFYKFLGEFAMFCLQSLLHSLGSPEIILSPLASKYEYTVRLLPRDKLGIKKTVQRGE
mgnify:CR=1 FL=1